MRALWLGMLLMAGTAHAEDPKGIASLRFFAPTCDDGWIGQQVSLRMVSACGIGRSEKPVVQYIALGDGTGCEVVASVVCDGGVPPGRLGGQLSYPTVYLSDGQKGWALALMSTEVDLSSVPLRWNTHWGNKANSMRVPAGWTVKLCTEAEGRGVCSLFTSDVRSFNETPIKNDKAMWAEVSAPGEPAPELCPQVFENGNYGGKVVQLCEDGPLPPELDNKVDSVTVPAGWTIELCDKAGDASSCATLSADEPDLNKTAVKKDKASAVRILSRP